MDTVTFKSGDLQLRGLLWKPIGSSPALAVLFNHGSEQRALKYLWRIAPGFLNQGYAFFAPVRRGQGLSQGQGKYIISELDSAEKSGGADSFLAKDIIPFSNSSPGLQPLLLLPDNQQ
jgi:carboxymethylenebutenolidase